MDSSAACQSCALFTTMTLLSLRISKMPAKSKKRKAQLINAGIRISGKKKVEDDEEDAVIHDDEDDWHEGEDFNGYDFNADSDNNMDSNDDEDPINVPILKKEKASQIGTFKEKID